MDEFSVIGENVRCKNIRLLKEMGHMECPNRKFYKWRV